MTLDEKHVNSVCGAVSAILFGGCRCINVIMVRDTLEDGSSLSLRGTVMEQYAASADLFFSIHHNAANTTARGAEVLAQIADKNGGPSKILGEALLDEYSATRESRSGRWCSRKAATEIIIIPTARPRPCSFRQ